MGEYSNIWFSPDGGDTWESRNTPLGYHIYQVQYLNNGQLYAMGWYGIQPNVTYLIATSNDDGLSWTYNLNTPSNHYFNFMRFTRMPTKAGLPNFAQCAFFSKRFNHYTYTMRFLLTFTLLIGLHCTQAQTAVQTKPQQLTVAKPESVGMSSERFKNIEQFLQKEVDQKHLPGGMLIVARKGKIVYHNAVGYHDLEAKKPLQKDQIFRIMSMSKALTTTAVMMLYEEGKIDLDDPASKYIPEFANTQVLVYYNEKDSTYSAVPAKKQVTIRHLLNHTAGIPYSHPLYYKAGIPDFFSRSPKAVW